MNNTRRLSIIATLALLLLGGTSAGQAQQSGISFFITSSGSGNGADHGLPPRQLHLSSEQA